MKEVPTAQTGWFGSEVPSQLPDKLPLSMQNRGCSCRVSFLVFENSWRIEEKSVRNLIVVNLLKIFSKSFGKTLLCYRVDPPKPRVCWLLLRWHKNPVLVIRQNAVLFSWLLYKYSYLQVLAVLVYLALLNTPLMTSYSVPNEQAALFHHQRQQGATSAAAKQPQAAWSVLAWPLKQPDCSQTILGIGQQNRES